jgi:hypothetical protein
VHAAIRIYRVEPGSADEVMQSVNEGFLPIIKDAPGFQAYYALDAGLDRIATVSVFEDQAGAEESIRLASDWVRQNIASLLPDPPEVLQGEVRAHEAASAGPVSGVTDTVGGATDTVGGVTGSVADTVGGVTGGLLGGGKDQEREDPGRRER